MVNTGINKINCKKQSLTKYVWNIVEFAVELINIVSFKHKYFNRL